MLHPLLDINLVDTDNTKDMYGFATLILSNANSLGWFISEQPKYTNDGKRIINLANRWIEMVKPRLEWMPAGDALSLSEAYDLMHSLAFNSPAPSEIIEKQKLRAFSGLMHGDETVDEYHIFRTVKNELAQKNKSFSGGPVDWLSISLNRYMANQSDAANSNTEPYAAIQQSAILMDSDLRTFEHNQNIFKKKVFNKNRHFLDELDSLSLDSLLAINMFRQASNQFLDLKERIAYSKSITAATIAHPDTNRFYRASLKVQINS